MLYSFKNASESHQGCQSSWKLPDSHTDASQKNEPLMSSCHLVPGRGIHRWRSHTLPQFHSHSFSESGKPRGFFGQSQRGEISAPRNLVTRQIRLLKPSSVLSYSDHLRQQRPGVSCNNYQWNKGVLWWHQSFRTQRAPVSCLKHQWNNRFCRWTRTYNRYRVEWWCFSRSSAGCCWAGGQSWEDICPKSWRWRLKVFKMKSSKVFFFAFTRHNQNYARCSSLLWQIRFKEMLPCFLV